MKFDWTTNVGSVDAKGLFTAQPMPGSGTVTATNGTVNYSATVDVVPAAMVNNIVTPGPRDTIWNVMALPRPSPKAYEPERAWLLTIINEGGW